MSNITEIKAITSLEKIYDTEKIPQRELKSFSMLKNEKKSFQVAVEVNSDAETEFKVESDFKKVLAYTVVGIKSELPMWDKGADDYYRFSKSGLYPDLLLPVDGKVSLKKGVNVLWFEVDGADCEAGTHKITVSVDGEEVSVDCEVIAAELDFGDFLYTNWFHCDCLMSHYGFEAFSDEFWRVVENFLRTAREYGMNCVLTPIFTPPLDTEKGTERPTVQLVDVTLKNGVYSFNFDKLTRWIEMAERCGVECFELSHLYTQWGAKNAPKIMATVDGEYKRIFGWDTKADSREYKTFLEAFSVELKKYLEGKNLKDRVLIHVSDEPNLFMLPQYTKASKYIHKLFDGYKIVDALSEYLFYKLKVVSNPIPATDHADKFLGNVKNLWVYYCSAQKNHYVSNRFFCNDSIRTRVIGYQLYKFDIKGFLHWGYNFYYKRLSKGVIDPFVNSDAGKGFPSGDSYIVYPAKDGTAYHSLRLKVFYDGLQDMAALRTLEKLADKKTCLDIIEQGGKINLTFREYPHGDAWLLDTREEVNRKIKELIG